MHWRARSAMMSAMATETETKTARSTAEVARSYFEAVAAQDLDEMESHYEPGSVDKIHGLVELRVGDNYRQ